MFDAEFENIPLEYSEPLKRKLESVVRLIGKRYRASKLDYSVKNYSAEELSAMVDAVFDLAARLRPSEPPTNTN